MQNQAPGIEEREKRTWVYLRPPKAFEMAPCECGNHDTQWSEFDKHLWCDKCKLDFKPKHAGILQGAVPVQTAHMLGVRFDRIHFDTQQIERWDPVKCEFVPEAKAAA